jgi:hypothetical protein
VSTLAEIEAAAQNLTLHELRQLERRVQKLREQRALAETPQDINDHSHGVIRLPQDPLTWQRQVRAEWG